MDGEHTLSDQVRRGELLNRNCPSRDVLRHLTSRWGVLVLIVLLERGHRFSELRRRIGGVSEKMLAQTLQALEADGFVNRISHPVVPPHVDYSLTPIGKEAALKVRELADWIEVNIGRIQGQVSTKQVATAEMSRMGE
ncbi:winged helix-turn-helix transcriptional regulator [Roseibium aggregatum]|uniref:Helix-turn-helix transcriptional regulator n=1 Tax=Roseibium aggregatum TaxID=187304 RepID=A0A939EE88_9HYPH|nr:helix-turn-helix transcriptional regulator [Roseibium aggregatum]